jgi:DNA (cytosine-5)-methyltransferase 1
VQEGKCIVTTASNKDVFGTLMANAGTKQWLGNQEAFTGDYHIINRSAKVYETHPADSRVKEMGDVSQTVTSRWGTGGGNVPLVQAISLQDVSGREKKQNGKGWNDDGVSYTVDTHATQGVVEAYSIREDAKANNFSATPLHVTPALQALRPSVQSHHAQTFVAQTVKAYSFDSLASNSMKSSNVSSGCREVNLSKTLDTTTPCPSKNQGGIGIIQSQGVDVYNQAINGDVAATSTKACGGSNTSGPKIMDMAVRRLTPIECERLQGFPDGYTNIPWRGKEESPDGQRYKAMGNSMAVPVMRWIGKRIKEIEG